ncbi:hypothetical protein ABPG75_010638 [Micractinium tetrahymenae]
MAPLRVVSLLPSATEIIQLVAAHCDTSNGVPFELVGRSHECDFPGGLEHLPSLTAAKTQWTDSADVDRQVREALSSGTGLYSVDREQLQQLGPDIIVMQSLCSVCSVDFCYVQDIAAGIEPRPQVADLNPQSLQEVLADVRRVGGLLGQPAAGETAAAALQGRVDAALAAVPRAAAATGAAGRPEGGAEGSSVSGRGGSGSSSGENGSTAGPSVAFVEWVAPIFVGGHWTPQLIEMAGGRHLLNPCTPGGGAGKSFAATPEQVAESRPDWVVVAPCGLDLATARKEMEASLASQPWWQELPAVKAGRVVVVDGNQMFNRPGPRLVDALEFLVGLLHDKPEVIPAGFPYERVPAAQ